MSCVFSRLIFNSWESQFTPQVSVLRTPLLVDSGERLPFWATVGKAIRSFALRPMLSDRCLVCLVTLVCCGQTVGWIKMPLGTEIGLGPCDIVLWGGDWGPSPPLFGTCLL